MLFDAGAKYFLLTIVRFPAQEKVGGDSKIPTILYYDQMGNIRAAGAEAMQEGLLDLIEDEGWVKAEWYIVFLLSEQPI
jgi:hypothetical protein